MSAAINMFAQANSSSEEEGGTRNLIASNDEGGKWRMEVAKVMQSQEGLGSGASGELAKLLSKKPRGGEKMEEKPRGGERGEKMESRRGGTISLGRQGLGASQGAESVEQGVKIRLRERKAMIHREVEGPEVPDDMKEKDRYKVTVAHLRS